MTHGKKFFIQTMQLQRKEEEKKPEDTTEKMDGSTIEYLSIFLDENN